jgi:hypothetical protein
MSSSRWLRGDLGGLERFEAGPILAQAWETGKSRHL